MGVTWGGVAGGRGAGRGGAGRGPGEQKLTFLPLVSCSAASTEGDTSIIGDRSTMEGQVSAKSGLSDLFFLIPNS